MSRRPFRVMTNRLQRCVDAFPSGDGEDGDAVQTPPRPHVHAGDGRHGSADGSAPQEHGHARAPPEPVTARDGSRAPVRPGPERT